MAGCSKTRVTDAGMLLRHLVVATVTGSWLGCAHPSSRLAPVGAPPRSGGSVSGDDLHGIPARQAEDLLEGRVAGVWVVRSPNGGVSLRIWGPSSIYGDNEPLYVLDGMPLTVARGRGLFWLDPNDIGRIEILKDVSALAMYGVRGANGVVLITTRHGERQPN